MAAGPAGEFDVRLRVSAREGGRTGGEQRCTGCGSPLDMHQPDPDVPHRLLGCCSCDECGVWYALIVTPGRERVYLIRLPSVVELVEAIARRGDRE